MTPDEQERQGRLLYGAYREAYRVYPSTRDGHTPAWDTLSPRQRAAWRAVVAKAAQLLTQENHQ